jgi:hypothetical protein
LAVIDGEWLFSVHLRKYKKLLDGGATGSHDAEVEGLQLPLRGVMIAPDRS